MCKITILATVKLRNLGILSSSALSQHMTFRPTFIQFSTKINDDIYPCAYASNIDAGNSPNDGATLECQGYTGATMITLSSPSQT